MQNMHSLLSGSHADWNRVWHSNSVGCLHDDVMKSILSNYAEPHTLLTAGICGDGVSEGITAEKPFVPICFGS